MNASDILLQQHKKARELLNKLESGRGDASASPQLANDLAADMAIEHERFSPASTVIEKDSLQESFQEHTPGELAFKRLLSSSPEEEGHDAYVCWPGRSARSAVATPSSALPGGRRAGARVSGLLNRQNRA